MGPTASQLIKLSGRYPAGESLWRREVDPCFVKGLGNWMAADDCSGGLAGSLRDTLPAQGSCRASGRSRMHRAPDHEHNGTPKHEGSRALHKGCRTEAPSGGCDRATDTGREQIVATPERLEQPRILSIFFKRILAGWRPLGPFANCSVSRTWFEVSQKKLSYAFKGFWSGGPTWWFFSGRLPMSRCDQEAANFAL